MNHKCDGCRYKGEHQEMMFRPMGVCTRELNLVDAVKNYEAEKCPYPKNKADRIRAMSDEDLAEMLFRVSHDMRKPLNKEEVLRRLQEPCEEFQDEKDR